MPFRWVPLSRMRSCRSVTSGIVSSCRSVGSRVVASSAVAPFCAVESGLVQSSRSVACRRQVLCCRSVLWSSVASGFAVPYSFVMSRDAVPWRVVGCCRVPSRRSVKFSCVLSCRYVGSRVGLSRRSVSFRSVRSCRFVQFCIVGLRAVSPFGTARSRPVLHFLSY